MNALFFLGLIFPFAICAFYNLNWTYSLISPVFWFLLYGEFIGRYGLLARAVLVPLNMVYALFSLLLGVSLYIQGGGFNEQFIFHLDPKTLEVALGQYTFLSILAILVFLFISFYPLMYKTKALPAAKGSGWHKSLILFLVSVLLFSPMHSLVLLANDRRAEALEEKIVKLESVEIEVMALSTPPKNLILLYLESLEQLYFDESLYPGLLPNLTKLKSQAHHYSNMKQVSYTGWTMAGLVASQCGVPLNNHTQKGHRNLVLATLDYPLPDYVCLGDILKAYDYQNVIFKGASLKFSGAANFLKFHGFDKAKGRDDWLVELNKPALTGWGIYDDMLFDLAYKEIKSLRAEKNNFAFSLVTLDTHHPSGHASASCPKYEGEDDSMLHALHCTDFLVGKFINKLEKNNLLENTVLAVFSDHLAMRNTQWNVLKEHEAERRLTYIVKTNEGAKEMVSPGTHFDVTPTLLDYMGIPGFSKLNAGVTMRGGSAGSWFQKGTDAHVIARSASYTRRNISIKNGFDFSMKNNSLIIDEMQFKISARDGWSLKDESYFGITFDKNGLFKGVFSSKQNELVEKYGEDFVVVVSRNLSIKEMVDAGVGSEPYYLLYGVPNKQLVIKNLRQDESVSAEELARILGE